MSYTELEKEIETAWENRDSLTPDTTGPVREAIENALEALDSGNLRVAEKKDGAWTVNQWAKKAVLLSFRINDMWMHRAAAPTVSSVGGTRCRPSSAGWDRRPTSRRRASFARCRAAWSAAFGLYRAGRDPDAELSSTWAPTWIPKAPWSIPGPPSAPAPRSARTATISGGVGIGGVSGAAAGRPGYHRGQLLHRRALRSGRRRHRRGGLGAVHGRLHRSVDQDRRSRTPARCILRPRARLFGGGAGLAAGPDVVDGKPTAGRSTAP